MATLLGTSLVFTIVVGLIGYLSAASQFDPLERFKWSWHGGRNIWLPIAIVTGWLGLLAALVAWLVRRTRRSFAAPQDRVCATSSNASPPSRA